MSTRVKGRKSDPFPIPPEGLYQAVCVDVWEIWTEKSNWPGKEDELTDKTRIVFEINKTCKEKPLIGQPFQVSGIYTASMHKEANLRKKLIEPWRGRKLTDEQALDFDLEVLVGQNCQLQVIHHIASSGTTYANIAGVLPLVKGMVKMRVSPDFVRKKDRDKAAQQATQHANANPPASDDNDEWGPPSVGPDDDDDVPF